MTTPAPMTPPTNPLRAALERVRLRTDDALRQPDTDVSVSSLDLEKILNHIDALERDPRRLVHPMIWTSPVVGPVVELDPGPRHGHRWHLNVWSQGAHGVVGEPPRDEPDDGAWLEQDPFHVTLRAPSLRAAMNRAGLLELGQWFRRGRRFRDGG